MEETKPMAAPVPPSGKPLSKKLITIIAIVVATIVVIASVSYVVMRQGDGGGIFGEKDSDGDGHPDTEDAFPNDASEWKDSDSDGVGDNSDAFPNDATETKDSDNDGVGDNSDAFPNNPNEQYDSDNDGVGNNADAFPYDSTQWADRDSDGYGDNPNGINPDAFPDDPSEWKDSDSDGIGDNADIYDSGNGGIKVCITSYQGDGSSDESGAPDPYFKIIIDVYYEGSGYPVHAGNKTSSVYTDKDTISYPLTFTVDVDDNIRYVWVLIEAWDDDFWSSDDKIDLNGTYTDGYNAFAYIYPRTDSYSSFSDDGRLDLADEMDGIVEYYIQVIAIT